MKKVKKIHPNLLRKESIKEEGYKRVKEALFKFQSLKLKYLYFTIAGGCTMADCHRIRPLHFIKVQVVLNMMELLEREDH